MNYPYRTGLQRRDAVFKELAKYDIGVLQRMSEYEIANAYPIWGIKRSLYRKYIREWCSAYGVELRVAA